ncbi:MAG: hypothetical protein ACPH7H_06910 [Porticoccaceae bacterium]
MTSYASEKDYLLDQIESNKEAIEFVEEELEKVLTEMPEDHAGTKEKIVSVYTRGIEYLKRDIKKKYNKVKPLTYLDSEDMMLGEMHRLLQKGLKKKNNKNKKTL